MYNFSRHILPFFLLLITTFLSANIYPPISSTKCLQDVMFHFADHQSGDEEIYYYHGDHLGSASWITDKSAKPIQYIHYLPYGEILANQRASGYDERFKFTTKELDAESGYFYLKFANKFAYLKNLLYLCKKNLRIINENHKKQISGRVCSHRFPALPDTSHLPVGHQE